MRAAQVCAVSTYMTMNTHRHRHCDMKVELLCVKFMVIFSAFLKKITLINSLVLGGWKAGWVTREISETTTRRKLGFEALALCYRVSGLLLSFEAPN